MTRHYYQADGVTLYHGDCRTIAEWLTADILVTDPPYGMSYVSGNRVATVRADPIAGDHSPKLRDHVLRMWAPRPAIVFGTWRQPRPRDTRQLITWWKRKAGPGMGDLTLPWGNATEEIYILGSGFTGKRRENLIVTDEQRGNPYGLVAQTGHPTPKPVELLEQLINCCPPGVIADPFAGSGSTLLAARNLGRLAIGIEIDERYCETTATRLSQMALTW